MIGLRQNQPMQRAALRSSVPKANGKGIGEPGRLIAALAIALTAPAQCPVSVLTAAGVAITAIVCIGIRRRYDVTHDAVELAHLMSLRVLAGQQRAKCVVN